MTLFVVISSGLVSFFLLKGLIPQLRRSLLDKPNVRSSHLYPTPRGGGISFVVVGLFSSFIAFLTGQASSATALSFLAAPLAFVGLLDDRLNLTAGWRYGFQLLTAVLIIFVSPLVHPLFLSVTYGSWISLVLFCLLLIFVTAVINFTNFMDGLDGLVGGCMTVIIASLAIALDSAWPLWAVVGSLLGFLLWNWNPAKVFMGDVGSTFLGAIFAGMVLQASSWLEALGYLLVATPILGDSSFCVLRRLLAGQRVFQAHRLHLFQRLHQAGWSHAKVSLVFIGATVLLSAVMLIGDLFWLSVLAGTEIMFGVWLDQRVAVPFAMASKR